MRIVALTPGNWTRATVGKFCDVQLGKMLQNEPFSEKDEFKPYLRAINIGKKGLDLSYEFSMWIRPKETERFRLIKGDILVSEGGDAGRTAIFDADGEYYFQNAINRVRPDHRGKIEPDYIYYWFTFLKAAGYVEMMCNVATIPHFTAEKVKAAPLAFPPLETQRRIVRFLDEKTARIDGLIEKKRELLDRLAEKRQALITRAVTKGLNPDAPMKPSGIDWLGDIPAHWEVKPLKNISPRISVGIVVTPAAYYADEGVLAIRGLNLRPMGFDFSDSVKISDKGHELHLKSELHEGDLVAVRTGEPGTTSVISADLEGTNCVDLVIIRKSPNASSRFLGWFLNSDVSKVQYAIGSEGALQLHFNVETSQELTVAFPPREEQRQIAEYIDRRLKNENERAERVAESVELLHEYRTALITAAVTGQIEELL
ncbi:MAG: restriction endonuclease subunit S [Gammaproteobacteria bacterium]|nr:restriction endonuclease subunit S [Gammaproteobacteria bacterium]MXW46771.1 restriction endonuclease subunit S [Gammaproteobacteria bacterium]MYD03257.1 restriction endonuclease subunit S [Gammaproteobacteria bacterium]MYE48234.1 restriction endonuclease subunit S [Gammaproteobacteria bacterium]MYI24207.1 restriction endonuclease subunit S [Gammaproteobacteria bacterium]